MTGQEGIHENYKKKSDLKQMAGSLFSQEEKKKKKKVMNTCKSQRKKFLQVKKHWAYSQTIEHFGMEYGQTLKN